MQRTTMNTGFPLLASWSDDDDDNDDGYSSTFGHISSDYDRSGIHSFLSLLVAISRYYNIRGKLHTKLPGIMGKTSLSERKTKSLRVLGIEIEK